MATSAGERDGFVLAQLSDIHCGDPRFDPELLQRTIADVNSLAPDLVVVGGDLTANGYLDEFEQAREFLDGITVAPMVTILGNHDCRNVGWVHYKKLFGETNHVQTFALPGAESEPPRKVRVAATNSNRPDVNEGEIGLRRYKWIAESFEGQFEHRIFVLHHHMLPIPGTGRERSVVLDGGDVLWALGRAGVDIVLSGHKHVPWVWDVGSGFVITSGTASTWRTRGDTPPSYNVIRFTGDEVEVTFRNLVGVDDTVQVFSGQRHRRRLSGEPENWTDDW